MENSICRIIGQLYDKNLDCNDGSVADYIPELAKANPEWFGICIFTIDGHGYAIGDSDQPFTIQSISKAFTYGMILDEYGVEEVEKRIGVEPSGEAFNSISLDPETGRPRNPMINAGAIAASGMVRGAGLGERFDKILRRSMALPASSWRWMRRCTVPRVPPAFAIVPSRTCCVTSTCSTIRWRNRPRSISSNVRSS